MRKKQYRVLFLDRLYRPEYKPWWSPRWFRIFEFFGNLDAAKDWIERDKKNHVVWEEK
jgi:hypothetical protein